MGKLILCIWILIAVALTGCSEGDRTTIIHEGPKCVVSSSDSVASEKHGRFKDFIKRLIEHYRNRHNQRDEAKPPVEVVEEELTEEEVKAYAPLVDIYQIVGETETHYVVVEWNGYFWDDERIAIEKWKIDMSFDQIECLEE